MAKMNWLEWIASLGKSYSANEVEEILREAVNDPKNYGWSNPNPHQYAELTAQEYYERLLEQNWDEIEAYEYTKKLYGK